MLRLSSIFLLLTLLSSCSTIFHNRNVAVSFYTDVDSAEVKIVESGVTAYTPTKFYFDRSKNDISLTVTKDMVTKDVLLKSKLSKTFWFGNLFTFPGSGYLVDLTNPKRFTYPKHNYIYFTENGKIPKAPRSELPQKGQINLKFAIPEGNHFYLNKGNGYGNTFGFLGISAGIEYYISDLFCINAEYGGMMDFMVPFPAPVDYEGSYDRSYASYMDLQLGRELKNFHVDLGIQGNRTSYYERETVELFPEYIDTLKYSIQQYNAGFALSTYYKFSNVFNVGVNYYPSFFSWRNNEFNLHYSHLIMFELIFKIRAFTPKRK